MVTGVGAAAEFTELPWAHEQFKEKLGFPPFPGTFNVRLTPSDVATWSRIRAQAGVEITPEAGACVSYCYPVLVNGSVHGAVLSPEVPNYPADVVEILAETHLRSILGVADGDAVDLVFEETK